MKTLILTAALASSAIAGAAFAQTSPPPPAGQPPMYGKHHGHDDMNGDGVVTRDEFIAAATRRFDRMDTNHDGKLDQAERDAMRQRRMARSGDMGPDGGTPPQN